MVDEDILWANEFVSRAFPPPLETLLDTKHDFNKISFAVLYEGNYLGTSLLLPLESGWREKLKDRIEEMREAIATEGKAPLGSWSRPPLE